MNWGEVVEGVLWGLGGLILFSVIVNVIRDAVIKSRKAGAYRAELDAPELSGYGGKITASFDSEKELIEFLQRYAQDIIRWSESPDRKRSDR